MHDAWCTIEYYAFRVAGKVNALDLVVRELRLEAVTEEHWSAILELAYNLNQTMPRLHGAVETLEGVYMDSRMNSRSR